MTFEMIIVRKNNLVTISNTDDRNFFIMPKLTIISIHYGRKTLSVKNLAFKKRN